VDCVIALRGVSFSYSHGDAAVLKRVNLDFEPGEFSLITGATGSGKTTILKAINRLIPNFSPGTFQGQVLINQIDVTHQKPQQLAELVGYVPQSPDESFVAQNVIDELAFGMEQLGVAPSEMLQRIEAIAAQVGIKQLLSRAIDSLSGGEKQRLAIAAALVAGQRVLLLDEPTSSLDSTSAAQVLSLLRELSTLHGVTVLIAEHRVERVLPLVDSIVTVYSDGSVDKKSGKALKANFRPAKITSPEPTGLIAEIKNLAVEFDGKTVFRNLNLKLGAGSITALTGPNGSGKSSCLWAIQGSGIRSTGSVLVNGLDPAKLKHKDRLALVAKVPQRATDLLFLNTVSAELFESDMASGANSGSTAKILKSLVGRIDPTLHPRDLSAGQKLALVLAIQLVKDAPLLLLDEPTQGLDNIAKDHLAKQLRRLATQGKAILLASHDEEFVSSICDQVIRLEQSAT
jgi:energy-coupling factor transport system ATP-binding protein